MPEIITEKPQLAQYDSWLCEKVGRSSRQLSTQYLSATAMAKEAILTSQIWLCLVDELSEANDAYRVKYKTPLIVPRAPLLLVKPYESFLNKNYRKNVLNNSLWPEPPEGGWIFPPGWICSLNDVFRTSLTVSYVDGIQFLSDRLSDVIVSAGGAVHFDLNSSLVGYYAGHLIVDVEVEIPDLDFNPVRTNVKIEIQITTHVKEAVKTILHPIYERARISAQGSNKDWQ
ncbi:hypothetical protein [Brevundimonas sp. DC300-4]|uniref:hypothetical protein n=1 Tax=Brevundimonas sp. DC300-4 TaxID=2804594 RepID=UPI003CEAA5FA